MIVKKYNLFDKRVTKMLQREGFSDVKGKRKRELALFGRAAQAKDAEAAVAADGDEVSFTQGLGTVLAQAAVDEYATGGKEGFAFGAAEVQGVGDDTVCTQGGNGDGAIFYSGENTRGGRGKGKRERRVAHAR